MTAPMEPAPALTGIAVTDGLCRRVETLAEGLWGLRRLIGWQPLNSQPHLRVARATFAEQGTDAPRSAIIKYLDPAGGSGPLWQATLGRHRNELAVYEVLMACRDRFDLFPRRLARDEDLILLKDLGVAQAFQIDDLPRLLTTTLLHLHRATVDLDPAALADTGLSSRLGAFRLTARMIADQARILIGLPAADFLALADALATALSRPGPITTLQHCDLADPRQMIWQPPTLYLIDFEHARMADLAADIAVAMIGRAEVLLKPSMLLYNRLPLPTDFPATYRRAWMEETCRDLPTDLWAGRLTELMIFEAFCTLATFYQNGGNPAFTPLARSQKLVLSRLLTVAAANGGDHPLLAHLAAINRRIV